jgi:hypothetical protein
MSVDIYNGTSHDLNFYRKEDVESSGRKLVVKEGATPYLTIPKHGELNAVFSPMEQLISENPVPLYRGIFPESTDLIPTDSRIVVASRRYVDAAISLRKLGTSKLATVKDVVFNHEGTPVGCLGLLSV